MLEKIVTIEEITVQPVSGFITVRDDTNVVEDGKSIAKTVKQIHLAPGNNVSSLPKNVQDICAIVWTPAVVAAYQAAKAASETA